MKTAFYTLMLLLALSGCKENANKESYATAVDTVAVEEVTMNAPMAADAANYDSGIEKMEAPVPPPVGYPDAQQKIIKNAALKFEAKDLDTTALRINRAVKKYKGFVQNDTQNNDDDSFSRTVTVRLPSANFEAFLAYISRGVAYFDRKEISSDDVTEEYIDVEARLKAKKILEARYFELLKKAAKVSEMLEIEKNISGIREEIESQEGRLKYMQNRVSMSTITIEFYKNTVSGAGTTQSYGSKIWNSVASGFNSLSSFLLGLLSIWPFILIFVFVFIIIRNKIKKRRKNHA